MNEPALYDQVILLRELTSDSSRSLPPGTPARIVDVLGPGGYLLEVRFPDRTLVGGYRIDTVVASADDVAVTNLNMGDMVATFDGVRRAVREALAKVGFDTSRAEEMANLLVRRLPEVAEQTADTKQSA